MGILSILSSKRQNIKMKREDSDRVGSDNLPLQEEKAVDYNLELEKIFSQVSSIDNLKDYSNRLLSLIAKTIEASQCAFFIAIERESIHYIHYLCGFAYHLPETEVKEYEFGDGLSGQVAKEGKMINIKNVPDGYINIISGLGSASPKNLLIVPIKENDERVIAVVEIASFKEIREAEEVFIDTLFKLVSGRINELMNNYNIETIK